MKMKKMTKTIATCSLAVLMACSLAACGNSKKDDSKSGVDVAGEQSTGDVVSQDTGVFKIGGIADLSGADKERGEAVRNGAQLAVDKINASGELGNRTMELNFQDNQGLTESLDDSYQALKDWGSMVLIGGGTELDGHMAIEASKKDGMFTVVPSQSSEDITFVDNVYKLEMSGSEQGRLLASYMAERGVSQKLAIIYNADDEASANVYQSFSDYNAEIGTPEVFSAMPYFNDTTDYSEQIQLAIAGDVDMVFLPVDGQEAMDIIRQANEMDFHPTFFGSQETSNIVLADNFDASLCEGMRLITSYLPNSETYTDTMVEEFAKAYEEKYGKAPDIYAAEGYDSVYALKNVIATSLSLSSMSITELCQNLVNSMPMITMNGLTGSEMTWSADGTITKSLTVVKIENGSFVRIE